jgi:hypothetical protein
MNYKEQKMAIRIRKIDNEIVALCAAKTKAKKNDIYLHDGIHYALATKFANDFNGENWNGDPILLKIMAKEEK